MKPFAQIKYAILTFAVMATFVFLYFNQPQDSETLTINDYLLESQQSEEQAPPLETTVQAIIYVDVKGEVHNPGVYSFQGGDRINQAIDKAGGFTDQAAQHHINLAQIMEDQMLILVPSIEEEDNPPLFDGSANGDSMANSTQMATPLVNINTADETLLMTLPNIGPSKAQGIIEYRQSHGSFQDIADIMEVSGIGVKTFEKLESLIEVN